MRSPVLRTLVLGVGLLLALPPGWCCQAAPRPQTPEQAPIPSGCCGGPRQEEPPPAAPTAPNGECCCQDNHKAPPKSDPPTVDLAFAVPLPWPAADGLPVPSADVAPAATSVCFIPLRLLLCVWLC
jgi:hypothetical protein